MRAALAYLVILLAAATPWLEVLLVVPVGVLAGLPVGATIAVATAGNVASLLPVVLAGDRLRAWIVRRRGRRADGAAATGRGGRAQRLLDRYGVPGLAAVGPLLTGVHLAATVAMATGATRRRTLGWFTVAILAWAVIAAMATTWGLDLLVDRDSLPDLGLR